MSYYDSNLEDGNAIAPKSKEMTEREYHIKKGRVLERFNEKFHERYKHSDLYRNIREMLIRDADPYELLEKVIEINDNMFAEMKEMMPYVSPNYHLHKKNQ